MIGARIGLLTPEVIQLGVFALVIYTVAWRMLRHKGSSGSLAVATGNELDADVEGPPTVALPFTVSALGTSPARLA